MSKYVVIHTLFNCRLGVYGIFNSFEEASAWVEKREVGIEDEEEFHSIVEVEEWS